METMAMAEAAFWLEGVLLVIAGILGLLGNATAVYIFAKEGKRQRQGNFYGLMVALATFDFVYILVSIFIFAMPQFFQDFNRTWIYCHLLPVVLPAAQVIYFCHIMYCHFPYLLHILTLHETAISGKMTFTCG